MADYDVTAPGGLKFRVTAPEGATQDQVLAFAQQQFARMRSVPDSAPEQPSAVPTAPTGQNPNPGTAGLVKFGAGLAGAPVDAIEGAANLPPQAAKTLLMAAGRYDLASKIPMLRGSFGGSESIQRGLRATGVPGLNPDNPNPQDPTGTAAYDFAARGGAVPGGVLPAAASMLAEKMLGPDYAAVGSLAPTAAISGYNAARAPALAKEAASNVVRDQTLRDAQDLGLKVIPSSVNPNIAGSTLESLAGKAAVKQQITLDNAKVTTAVARQEAGLPGNAPITEQALEARRDVLSQPYRDLAAVSNNAQYYLRALRDARQKATQYWREYERQATVSSLENYNQMNAKAAAMEQRLEQEAAKVGRSDLVPAMKEARQAIAKTWDVERALNLGDGTVDAHALGRLYDKGAPLSGGLEKIAKFALGPGKQVTGEAASTPSPNVNQLKWYASPSLGVAGGMAGGPVLGTAAAAAPFVLPPLARQLVRSAPYQGSMGTPTYTPGILPENSMMALYRAALLQNEANK